MYAELYKLFRFSHFIPTNITFILIKSKILCSYVAKTPLNKYEMSTEVRVYQTEQLSSCQTH